MSKSNFSKKEMMERISIFKNLKPLSVQLDKSIPQEGKDIVYARELLSVIGLNDTKKKIPINKNAPIKGAAGITMTIAKCPPGQGPGLHYHKSTYETFTVLKGKFLIEWNENDKESIELDYLDTISIPPGVCRSFKNISASDGLLQVIISGGIHDMDDIEFTASAKKNINEVKKNLSKKFEDLGFKFR